MKKLDVSIKGQLDRHGRQEPYSISYTSAIATAAGYGVEIPATQISPDKRSTDLTITQYNLAIVEDLKVQAKCTFAKTPNLKKGYLSFTFDRIKNYNDLKNKKSPHILVVVHVPEDINKWVSFHDNSIELYHNAYWMSLRGMEDTDQQTKTIRIPLENRFTTESLTYLMNLLYYGKFVSFDNKEIDL